MDVLVVVPTYNEAPTLERVVAGIVAQGFGVLVVDDASPDGTGDLADRLAQSDPGISVIHRPVRRGLGPAYAEGFAAAIDSGAAIVCQMDADLSHDAASLSALIAAIRSGHDVAVGSRYVAGGATVGWSLLRRLLSRGGNLFARLALGLGVHDATSGFRAYRVEALQQLDPATCEAAGYAFQVEMTYRAEHLGLRVVEIPIRFVEREAGASKMTAGIAIEAMRLVSRWGLQRIRRRLRSAS